MKTLTIKPTDVKHSWHLVDLDGKTLGRISTEIAQLLIGKGKPLSGGHLDNGDFVVAINAAKIHVTGKKVTDKKYYSHSGFPGGLKELSFEQLLAKDPRKVIEKAVKGMLPKNKHQQTRLRRLKVYPDATHPYSVELGLNKETK